MKKVFITVLVVLCSFSVFAFKNEIGVKFNPINIQFVTTSEVEKDTVVSKYGIGADVLYRRFLVQGLFAEGGLSWNTYLLPEDRPAETSLMFFGGIGYDCRISKMVNFVSHIALGGDTLLYNKLASESLTIKTGVDFGLNLGKRFVITMGCDGTFGFAEKDGINYVTYRILPSIGTMIKL